MFGLFSKKRVLRLEIDYEFKSKLSSSLEYFVESQNWEKPGDKLGKYTLMIDKNHGGKSYVLGTELHKFYDNDKIFIPMKDIKNIRKLNKRSKSNPFKSLLIVNPIFDDIVSEIVEYMRDNNLA